jgi:hypothetical protein
MERFTDLNGNHLERQSLGCCLYGRLSLAPCSKSSGIDLYWTGSIISAALSDELRALIAMSWANLALLTDGHIRQPRPLPVTPGKYWLCRLVAGTYAIEDGDRGSELYEVFQPPPRITRPTRHC